MRRMRAAAALYCLFAFAVAAILVALLVFLGQLFVRSTLIKSLDVEIRRSTGVPSSRRPCAAGQTARWRLPQNSHARASRVETSSSSATRRR